MVENLGDTDGKKKGQQFTPTDWDWVMFLSGEINAAETRTDTVGAIVTATLCAFMGFILLCLTFLITYLGSSDSLLVSIIVIFVVVVTFVFARRVSSIFKEKKREAEERVKLLEKCRNEIFDRLDDPNKILERC